jgi:ABC-type nitrate/sulfonate/bicarbonate transport system ATPase subunit
MSHSALDAHTRYKMQEGSVAKETKTIVFVTHNIEEAIFLADRNWF